MKKGIKCKIFLMMCIIGILLIPQRVQADNLIEAVEYTQEFKDYLELSDEERAKILQPRMFDIPNTNIVTKNPLRLARLRGTLESRFSLKDIIGKNMVVKDQKKTNSCWAFASIASLETNLAMQNYYNEDTNTTYDFSERHMEYYTSREFANGKINANGFNRNVGSGGIYQFAEVYLTNGYGAIAETDMPFINNEETIDISAIQNKKVLTKVTDTVQFPSFYASSITTEEMNLIKEHIKDYGAIFAGIHGASGTALGNCYNNETGALYCNSAMFYPADHAVVIVGWDDNYSIENFHTDNQPTKKGAWIARNSWGETIELTLDEMKEEIFKAFESQCRANGWNTAAEIPDHKAIEVFEANGYTVENNKAVKPVGDYGYFYISYQDANVYKTMWAIEKASTDVDYDNIYLHDKYGKTMALRYSDSKMYLGSIFSKKTSGTEYLTEVSIYAPEACTCTVYVNPNGTSKAKTDLTKITLKAGESETVSAGYHTLEFQEPVEINGDNFAVIIEVQSTGYSTYFALESEVDGVAEYDPIEIESSKCFCAGATEFDNNTWIDVSKISEKFQGTKDGDLTIRAFTRNNLNDDSLRNIEITTPPTKTSYFEGDDFDSTGMVVTANYNNGESNVITNYSIENGSNLKEGQTSVTIKYEDKMAYQTITVEKNSVTKLEIATPPTKTTYKAGRDFEPEGMEVEATYKDGTTKTVTDYEIIDGKDLKNGQTTVTISYEGQTADQNITVEPNPIVKIEVTKAPSKTKYIVGQDFDPEGMEVKVTYEDGLVKKITSYTVEDGTNLEKDQTSVTISFEGQTTSQEITVEEKKVTKIEVKNLPTKTKYIQNKENLDLTGGTIKATYNDGTNEEVDMTSKKVTAKGYSNEELGTVKITIEYASLNTTFDVTIIEAETAKNSNFENAKAKINNIKLYLFTDPEEKEYELINVEISGIVRNKENDSLEYYYYLSPNQSEKNMQNWVKIKEVQNTEGKLIFTINTKDVSNYAELLDSDTVYLYIEEIAKKGGDKKVATYGAFKIEDTGEVETYLDGAKYSEETKNDTKIDLDNEKADTTTSKERLPDTGIQVLIIFVVVGLLSTVLVFIKYRTYKDI